MQLVDTAGWKRPGAVLPTRAPSAPAGHQQQRRQHPADTAASSSSSSSGSSSSGTGLSKQLADASLAQAKRALGSVHVVVLMMDGTRTLETNQVRPRGLRCLQRRKCDLMLWCVTLPVAQRVDGAGVA
jgi:hypothetical protein